ncbi:uncharacterized protein [Littorina saxatilis]|uniref:Uncharacterized protein n=1 Tax=Littorina saxatilis TaxID=31220 RepID=A0AAN9G441_9CAEN
MTLNVRKVFVLALCCVILVTLTVAPAAQTRSRSQSRSRSRSNSGSARRRASSVAQTTFTCKDRTTFKVTSDNLQRQPFATQCPREPVVDLEARAVRGNCSGSTASLRSSARRCEWNKTCSLPYNTQDRKMRTTEDGDYYLCTEQPPAYYEIKYNCLKRNADVKHVLGTVQSTRKAYGIIKSHTMYPWSYRNGDALGNLTFNKPRRPAGLSTLWITVRSLAIKDTDVAFLTWRNNSHRNVNVDAVTVITPAQTTYSAPNVDRVTLTFFADYTLHHSEINGPDNGFVFCYQWLSATARLRKGSACTRILQPGRCRAPRGSRGGGRRRGGRRQTNRNRRQ